MGEWGDQPVRKLATIPTAVVTRYPRVREMVLNAGFGGEDLLVEIVSAAMNEGADGLHERSVGDADGTMQYECEWEMIRGKGMIN